MLKIRKSLYGILNVLCHEKSFINKPKHIQHQRFHTWEKLNLNTAESSNQREAVFLFRMRQKCFCTESDSNSTPLYGAESPMKLQLQTYFPCLFENYKLVSELKQSVPGWGRLGVKVLPAFPIVLVGFPVWVRPTCPVQYKLGQWSGPRESREFPPKGGPESRPWPCKNN